MSKPKNNFYCQIMCGEENFSIEEWNKTLHDLENTNLSELEKDKILNPKMFGGCEKQCFDCMQLLVKEGLKLKNY